MSISKQIPIGIIQYVQQISFLLFLLTDHLIGVFDSDEQSNIFRIDFLTEKHISQIMIKHCLDVSWYWGYDFVVDLTRRNSKWWGIHIKI